MKFEFRMFDTEEKCFMNGSRIIESRVNDLNKEGRWIYQIRTGLKDVNGKDIFEGDILSDIEEKPLYIEYSEEKAAFCFVYKFDPYGISYYTVKEFHYEGLEIIGNILENPELLG